MLTDAEVALWDRSRSLPNFHLHAIALQIERLRIPLAPEHKFVLRPIAEFEFLCVSLVRLRRAATIAASVSAMKPKIEAALVAFDAALPRLPTLRNVAEHFDDYVLAKGLDQSLTAAEFRSGLQVLSWSNDSFTWFDVELRFDDCRAAAQALFRAIKEARR